MKGRINVKKTTYNTIFVEWNLPGKIHYDSGKLVSPPFTLIIDGFPVAFVLSIQCREKYIIQIYQSSSRIGRGIVFIAVKCSSHDSINTMKTCFIKKWDKTCDFNYFGTLTKVDQYTLTIDCKIIWLGFVNNIAGSNPLLPSSAIATTFSKNKVFPDLILIVEGQEIPSHKAILAGHSSVFLSMFETPMKELKENKVIIEDVECSTMEILLKIIYTGYAENLTDVNVILKVFYAAEKYQISTVKHLCEYKLQFLIDEDNVLELLRIGDKYRALELCETCIAFIMAIKNDEISMEFKSLSKAMPNIGSAAVEVLMDLSSLVPNMHE